MYTSFIVNGTMSPDSPTGGAACLLRAGPTGEELRCAALRCKSWRRQPGLRAGTSRSGSVSERSMGDVSDDTSYCMKRVRVPSWSAPLPVDLCLSVMLSARRWEWAVGSGFWLVGPAAPCLARMKS